MTTGTGTGTGAAAGARTAATAVMTAGTGAAAGTRTAATATDLLRGLLTLIRGAAELFALRNRIVHTRTIAVATIGQRGHVAGISR